MLARPSFFAPIAPPWAGRAAPARLGRGGWPRGQPVVAGGEESADVGEAVLLRAHRAAVGVAEDLADDLFHRTVLLPRLARLDEEGVLGEAAGVDVEGDAELAAELRSRLDVGEGDRLAAARVVGQGQHAEGDIVARLLEQLAEPRQGHVPPERMARVRRPPPRTAGGAAPGPCSP